MFKTNAPALAHVDPVFDGLFNDCSFSNDEIILMRMAFNEAHPSFRDFAHILAGERFLLRELFFEPMERWGTGNAYLSIREQERIICAKRILSLTSTIGMPYAIWSNKTKTNKPSWQKRLQLWIITIANAPLSLFFSLIFVQTLGALGWIPTWSFLLLSGLLPLCLGHVERHYIFPRYPNFNPAQWLVSLHLLPKPAHLESTANLARAAFSQHSDARHLPLAKHIVPISLRPCANQRKLSPSISDHDIQQLSFDLLLDQLRLDGKSPGIDAALAASAMLDKAALDKELPAPHGMFEQKAKRL